MTAINCVTPSQDRNDNGPVCVFYDPPRYRQTLHMPRLVVRGVMPFKYLELGDRFLGCTEASHIQDVLVSEGDCERPNMDPEKVLELDEDGVEAYFVHIEALKVDYDKRRKSARERVKKRRQRANKAMA